MGTQDQPTSRARVQRQRSKLAELIHAQIRDDKLRSIEEFADKYDIGRSTLYELLRGRTRSRGALVRPSLDTLVKLANAVKVPTHQLLYLFEPDAPGAGHYLSGATPSEGATVSIEGTIGGAPEQHRETHYGFVWVEQDFVVGKDLIAFRATGDSMAAGSDAIQDGDIIVVDRNDPGHDTASVVARLETHDLVLKMLKDDRFGRFLQSRNPEPSDGSPTVIPLQEATQIVGRVVRIIHDTNSS